MKRKSTLMNGLLAALMLSFATMAQAQDDQPPGDSTAVEVTTEDVEVTTDDVEVTSDDALLLIVDDLDLADLMNMEVSVASKSAEKISDAPGSITAYSSADMEKMGYYTLSDLASITAGYSSFRALNENSFETRGQWTSGGFDNNKHLVLVDGIPVYNARANMAPSDEMLPLFGVQRVEFLRGPGSALYGIGAFSGVINVVSKELNENGTVAESKVSVGNYDFKKRLMSNVIHKTDAGVFKFNVGYFAKQPTRQYLGDSAQYQNELARYYDDKSCIYLNSSYNLQTSFLKGTTLGFIYQRKDHGLGEWWMDQNNQTYELTDHTWQQIIPYLRYTRDINDKLSINSYLKGNISSENYAGSNGWQAALYWSGAGLSFFNIEVAEREFFGEAKYKINDNFKAVVGLNYVSRFGTGAPNNYVYYVLKDQGPIYNYDGAFSARTSTYNTYSAFAQLQYNVDFLKGLNITGGARMDMGRVNAAADGEVTNKYDQLSPRIALVQKITDQLNLKLMWGKALRAPMVKEVGGNEEAKYILLNDTSAAKQADAANVPNLNAETISSFEGVLTYNTKKLSTSFTYFMNSTENALYRGQTVTTQPIIQNIDGTIEASGFEYEIQVMPIKGLKVGANVARAKAELPQVVLGGTDTIAGGDPFNVPTTKINGVVTYSLEDKVSVSLIGRFVDGYTIGGFSPWRRSGSDAVDFNGTFAGNTVFDLNITGKVTENLSLELQVRNLLNEEFRTPAFFQSRRLNVPGAGRSLLFTVGYKF